MISIYRHRIFTKQSKKLPKKVKEKFEQKLMVFISDAYSFELNNHQLTVEWLGHRSIDITGDIRAIYIEDSGIIIFKAIGTHSQLYEK